MTRNFISHSQIGRGLRERTLFFFNNVDTGGISIYSSFRFSNKGLLVIKTFLFVLLLELYYSNSNQVSVDL